jgi:hypothetical protein
MMCMIPIMKVGVLLMEEVQLKAPLENPADRFRGYGVVCGCKSARDSAFEMNAHILYNQSASDSPLDKNKPSL